MVKILFVSVSQADILPFLERIPAAPDCRAGHKHKYPADSRRSDRVIPGTSRSIPITRPQTVWAIQYKAFGYRFSRSLKAQA